MCSACCRENKLPRQESEKGLTQEALAAELGVSRQTIAKWEQEISTPSVTNAHRLIDILGLTGNGE